MRVGLCVERSLDTSHEFMEEVGSEEEDVGVRVGGLEVHGKMGEDGLVE
jgi:hypothetical protein